MEHQRIEYNVFEKRNDKSNYKSNKSNKSNKSKSKIIKSKTHKSISKGKSKYKTKQINRKDPVIPEPLIKSKKQSINAIKHIKNTLEQLHKDLIGNIVLIHFFQSKNRTEFIDNINKYSLSTTNNELNLEQIHTFKKLYTLLKSSCKKSCKKKTLNNRNKTNTKTYSKKQNKGKNKKYSYKKLQKFKGGELIEGVKGGPYLYRLTEKGNKPITGNDLKKSLGEITEILDLVRHVDEGKWVKEPHIAISYFNGDKKKIKNYLQMELLPKYVNLNTFPPRINFSGIMSKISNVSAWMSIYNKDKEFRKNYIKEQGLDPSKYLKASKYDKMVAQVSKMDKAFKDAQAKKAKLTLSGYK